MKVLVTGSAGHLGEALVRTWRERGDEVVGLDILKSPFTTEVGSIVDRACVKRCMRGVQVVLHTATLHKPHVGTHRRQDFVDTNITGTLNLLEEAVAAGGHAFIFTSTTSVFGDALVPAAKKWPLDELMAACRVCSKTTGRRIFYEWTLIEGRNDSAENARAVGRLLRGLPAQVNLIPLNPTAGYDGAPTRSEGAKRFQKILADEFSLPSTVRQRRGIDIAAGCGQLAVGA